MREHEGTKSDFVSDTLFSENQQNFVSPKLFSFPFFHFAYILMYIIILHFDPLMSQIYVTLLSLLKSVAKQRTLQKAREIIKVIF